MQITGSEMYNNKRRVWWDVEAVEVVSVVVVVLCRPCLPASPASNRACAVNETAKRRLLVCSSSAYSLGTGSADGKFAVCLHW